MKLHIKNTSTFSDEVVHRCVQYALKFVGPLCLRPGPFDPDTLSFKPETPESLNVEVRGHAKVRYKFVCVGQQLGNSIWVHVNRRRRFPCIDRYLTWKSAPTAMVYSAEEALVVGLVHELVHWLGIGGNKSGEFLCEMISHAAGTDYRLRVQKVNI